jgi:hypothetical protein
MVSALSLRRSCFIGNITTAAVNPLVSGGHLWNSVKGDIMIIIGLAIIVFMVLAMIATPRIVKATHARMQRAAMSGEVLSKPLILPTPQALQN